MGKKIFNEAQSESKRMKKNPKTDHATMLMLPPPPQTSINEAYLPNTESLKVFQAIMDRNSEKEEEKWAKEVVESVHKRFKRMPKGGWRLMCGVFNERFKKSFTLEQLKILTITRNVSFNKTIGKENLNEGAESPNKEQMHSFRSIDSRLLNEVTKVFKYQHEMNSLIEIGDRPRTRKILRKDSITIS